MTPEAKLLKDFTAYAKKQGWLIKRNHMGRGAAGGWPDLELFSHSGKAVFIELKSPGKHPTALQFHRLNQLFDRGFTVGFADNLEDAKALIDGCVL